MRPTGYLLRQGKAGRPSSASAGPAMTTLRSVITYVAGVVRCLGAAYIVIQLFIWHSFFIPNPWRLAAPLAAVLWAAVAVLYLRHRFLRPSWPASRAACLDSAVYVALALSAESCVPPATRGEAANWLVIAMVSQIVVPAWFVPAWLSVPLALASPVAYWIGVAGVPSSGAGVNSPAAAGAVLVVCAAIHWCGRRMLYRQASLADADLARADQDAREQYVILSRNFERREQARLLHDTVLNTLTAVSRAGPGERAEIVRRCRHDMTLLEFALSDPGGPDGKATRPYDGLLGGLEAVAAEMRGRGLNVHVEVAGRAQAATTAAPAPGTPASAGIPLSDGTPAGDGHAADDGHAASAGIPLSDGTPASDGHPARGLGQPAEAGETLAIPAAAATAIVRAAREALANVADHAGTGEAWLQVSLTSPAGEPAGEGDIPGGVLVLVRDEGRGFDPEHIGQARLGVRRSVIERVADWGGQASIQSSPGKGTVVSLHWPGPAEPGLTQPRSAQPPGRPALAGGTPRPGSQPW